MGRFVEDLDAEGVRKVARHTRRRAERCAAQNGRESLSTYCDVHDNAAKVKISQNKMPKHFHPCVLHQFTVHEYIYVANKSALFLYHSFWITRYVCESIH